MFWRKHINVDALNDEQLMDHVCRGQAGAFDAIYSRYFNKLVWFARGFVDDREQAQDLVQEVFLKLIEKPEHFDSSRKFSTWIYCVTSNLCKQHLRNHKNRLRILEENATNINPASGPALTAFDTHVLKGRVSEIYASLSEKEKAIYTLRFEQDMSLKEIAEILAIPEGSVKSGIYYLLKKFANHLKEFNHEH